MQSLFDLAEHSEPLAPDTPGQAVLDRFNAEPDTLAIAVVDENEAPVGLVERNAFTLKIGSQYGRSLYMARPIALVMNEHPLVVEGAASPADLIRDTLSSQGADLLKGFIVVHEGRYVGVGSALGLLQASNADNHRHAAEMTELARKLEAAKTEAQSREESSRLLFQESPVAMCVWDSRTLRVLAVNDAALRQYGYSVEQVVGMNILNALDADQHQDFLKSQAAVPGDAQTVQQTWRHRRADGQVIEVQPFIRRTTYEGRPARLAALVDVTARKRNAELLAQARDAAETANRAKSEFLANMSHEIRTPLNGVLGITGVLARTQLEPRQREMVSIIENSTIALNHLLSDILDIARVESGRLSIHPEAFGLADLAREAAALFVSAALEKRVALELEIDPAAERQVVGDPVRTKQILVNLLSNAVKFTAEGAVVLRVQLEDPSQRTYRMEVRDTGVGFDPSRKNALFGRFVQADGSITRRFGGSGLGLAISRDLAELMGGGLDADSTPGQGAVFALTLPLPDAEHAANRVQTPNPVLLVPVEPAEVAARILLADDHATNRRVVELIMDQAGVQLTCVENGLEAVEAFKAARFDLVLMDLQMPVMDGLSAIAAIRDHEDVGGLDRTPILVLSANAMPEHLRACTEAGADGHIAKPITAGDLLAGVANALDGPPAEDISAAA
ncbi:MAG: ATP-binding protein [Caulobacteraceae bacterium]